MSAISRTVPLYPLWSLLWAGLSRLRGARPLTHIDDLPDDFLKDIGLEKRVPESDRHGDVWRRCGGVGDYLRPGPL